MTDPPAGAPPALVTDLYELTMASAYLAAGLDHDARQAVEDFIAGTIDR